MYWALQQINRHNKREAWHGKMWAETGCERCNYMAGGKGSYKDAFKISRFQHYRTKQEQQSKTGAPPRKLKNAAKNEGRYEKAEIAASQRFVGPIKKDKKTRPNQQIPYWCLGQCWGAFSWWEKRVQHCNHQHYHCSHTQVSFPLKGIY